MAVLQIARGCLIPIPPAFVVCLYQRTGCLTCIQYPSAHLKLKEAKSRTPKLINQFISIKLDSVWQCLSTRCTQATMSNSGFCWLQVQQWFPCAWWNRFKKKGHQTVAEPLDQSTEMHSHFWRMGMDPWLIEDERGVTKAQVVYVATFIKSENIKYSQGSDWAVAPHTSYPAPTYHSIPLFNWNGCYWEVCPLRGCIIKLCEWASVLKMGPCRYPEFIWHSITKSQAHLFCFTNKITPILTSIDVA